MFDFGFIVAFTSGLVSFFSPCVFPLLPTWIGYISGLSFSDIKSKNLEVKKKVFLAGIFYTLGFSIVYVLLGTAFSGIGYLLREYSRIVEVIGGILIVLFGLEFVGILHLNIFGGNFLTNFSIPKAGGLKAKSFLIGVIFAFAWSPCVGVVLGSILALAATSGSIVKGTLLLFSYALGISLPFILVSSFYSYISKYISKISRYARLVSILSGLVLIILGTLLVSGYYHNVNEIIHLFGI